MPTLPLQNVHERLLGSLKPHQYQAGQIQLTLPELLLRGEGSVPRLGPLCSEGPDGPEAVKVAGGGGIAYAD